jgi:hypothetical protein
VVHTLEAAPWAFYEASTFARDRDSRDGSWLLAVGVDAALTPD